ncbi:MAG: C10 family peptidase [Prevotella sp.]|nr:C10 family peptidase [Prevotella sp.]
MTNLYIYNAKVGKGFVIVAGDDRAEAVLGYSKEGSFTCDDMPENFKAWVEGLAAEIESLDKSSGTGNQSAPRRAPSHAAIAPLIQSRWGQTSPFNDLCPYIGSYRAVTGCVATAGAQLMYYYQHPKTPTPVIPGYEDGSSADTSQDLPSIVFDWEHMVPNYYSVGDQQAKTAVAELMLYCGYAAKLKYGMSGSGGQPGNMVNAMIRYFDYDGTNVRHISREHHSIEGWDSLLYHELEMGRPVLYNGTSNVGHAFLCDGYDGAGSYHFNWGWNGAGDGFFRLQALNPDKNSDVNSPGYIYMQNAVFGLQPNGWPLEDWDWRDDGQQPDNPVMNLRVDTFYIDDGYQARFTLTNLGDNYSDTLYVYQGSFEMAELPVRLKAGATRDFAVKLYLMGPPENGEFTYQLCTKGKAEVLAMTTKVTQRINLEAVNFQITGSRMSGTKHQVDVTVENHGAEFWNTLYMYVYPDGKMLAADAAIPKDGSDVVTYYFTPESSGTYTLTVYRDRQREYPIGSTTFKVGTVSITNVEFKGNMLASCSQNFDMTIENPFDEDFKSTFYIFQSQTNNKGYYVTFRGVNVPRNETVVLGSAFAPSLPGHWNVWITRNQNGSGVLWSGSLEILNLEVENIEIVGDRCVHSTQQINVTIHNPGGDFNRDVCLYASQTDDMGLNIARLNLTITAGATETVTFNFTPQQSGVWNLWIGADRRALNVLGSTQVEIINVIPGDVNGDGEVDVADFTLMACYLLGQNPATFIIRAADVAGSADGSPDGSIDIADLTGIANIILHGQGSSTNP